MGQQLAALAAPAEEPGLVPCTYTVSRDHLELQLQDLQLQDPVTFLAYLALKACGALSYRQNSHT